MSDRKPITYRMKLESLLLRFEPLCGGCGDPITWPSQEIEWDHGVPLALGGSHTANNIRPLHKACHAAKTRGSGATTAGSDIHMIAKTKGTRASKFQPVKLSVDKERPDKGTFGRRPFARAR